MSTVLRHWIWANKLGYSSAKMATDKINRPTGYGMTAEVKKRVRIWMNFCRFSVGIVLLYNNLRLNYVKKIDSLKTLYGFAQRGPSISSSVSKIPFCKRRSLAIAELCQARCLV